MTSTPIAVTILWDGTTFYPQGQAASVLCAQLDIRDYVWLSTQSATYTNTVPHTVTQGQVLSPGDPRAVRALEIHNTVTQAVFYIAESKDWLTSACDITLTTTDTSSDKVPLASVVNSLTTTEPGKVADARTVATLKTLIDTANTTISSQGSTITSQGSTITSQGTLLSSHTASIAANASAIAANTTAIAAKADATGYKATAGRIKLQEAANKGAVPTAMTSAPTITVSAAFGASTITSSIMTNADDAVFLVLGTVAQVWPIGYTPSPNLLYAASVTAGADGRVSGSKKGGDMRILFNTDAPAFEFGAIVSASPGNGYRIWVDGQPTALTPRTDIASDSQYRYVNVNFGSSANRRIMLEFEKYVGFGGIRIAPNYSLWKPTRLPVRMMMVGDSYTDGTGATVFLTGYARTVGQRLGITDLWINGEGNLGYKKAGSLSAFTARPKLAGDVIAYAPDWVVVALGINDFDQDATQLQTEVGLYFTQLLAGLPNAGVTVIGPWRAPGLNPPSAINAAIQAAVQALPENNTRIMYIDTYSENWQQNAGRVGATSGSGNSNIYIGSDNAHPVQAGHDYLSQRVYNAVMKHIYAVAV